MYLMMFITKKTDNQAINPNLNLPPKPYTHESQVSPSRVFSKKIKV